MKSIFKKSIIAVAILFAAVSISNAQVKVGANPTTIEATSSLEVEASTAGRKVKVNKATGQVTIKDGTEGSGKILTSDANGGASWKDNTSGSWTAIWYNFTATPTGNFAGGSTIKFGEGGTAVPGTIIIPKNGLYKISCASNAVWSSGDGIANFQMLVNGVVSFWILDNNVPLIEAAMFISTVQYRTLNAGDVLTVQRQPGVASAGVVDGSLEVTLMLNN